MHIMHDSTFTMKEELFSGLFAVLHYSNCTLKK